MAMGRRKNERLGFNKRVRLELNRVNLLQRTEEHELHQLFWECTLRCNLNCRHCGSDCRMLSEQNDMPLADFLKVLDEIRLHEDPSNVMVITTGGEPTMRRDLAQCGLEISKRGFVWGMVTNGMMLTPEKLNEFVENGLQSIAVSFDGFEEDHNWMRGNSLSFKNVLVAVEALKQHPGLTWDVITCVNQRTIKYLPEFRDYLISLGIKRWRLFTVFPVGRAAVERSVCRDARVHQTDPSRRQDPCRLRLRRLPRTIRRRGAKPLLFVQRRHQRGVGAGRRLDIGLPEHPQRLPSGKYLQRQLLGGLAKQI